MRSLSRVVWSEGMYLAPHHFQTQARHFENVLHFAASSIRPFGWGVLALDLDTDAITNGLVIVRSAAGVLPDGLVFDIPSSDTAPAPLDIREAFSPLADRQTLVLQIPVSGSHMGDVSRPSVANSAPRSRYIEEHHLVQDELSPQDTAQLSLGKRNFSLQLEADASGDYVQLPLARIRRIGAGRFAYDTTFSPAILQTAASDYVMAILQRLCNLIEEKAAVASEMRTADRRAVADQFRKDPVSFWYLHTLYRSLASLRHFLIIRRRHPEDLFVEMLQFAGALSCFVPDANLAALPPYDHENPAICFERLDEKLRQWLQFTLPSPCISVQAQPMAPSFWRATITDERHLQRSRWVIEIESDRLSGPELILRAPRLVKVCSERFIQELVRRAVPGAPLTYLPAPPPEIPVGPGGFCFDVSKTGPCWEDIMNTRNVGFYVPDEIPAPRMILHIVPEARR